MALKIASTIEDNFEWNDNGLLEYFQKKIKIPRNKSYADFSHHVFERENKNKLIILDP